MLGFIDCDFETVCSIIYHFAAGLNHSPVMHSPHIIHANKPKVDANQARGFTPVTSTANMSQHASQHTRAHVPTPPRPMSTHTPGMQPAGTPHPQPQPTPPLGTGIYHSFIPFFFIAV